MIEFMFMLVIPFNSLTEETLSSFWSWWVWRAKLWWVLWATQCHRLPSCPTCRAQWETAGRLYRAACPRPDTRNVVDTVSASKDYGEKVKLMIARVRGFHLQYLRFGNSFAHTEYPGTRYSCKYYNPKILCPPEVHRPSVAIATCTP